MAQTQSDLLMGAGMGQMNLQAVKVRADEIRRTLDHLLYTLRYAPASLQWSDALDRFAVLNIQIQHLSAQLRPLLQHYAVHPRSVNQTNAPILPIMLATKLLPEQEEEQEALIASGEASADMKACITATAELAALIDSLTANGGPLDPKGPARTQLTASMKAITGASKKDSASTAAQPPQPPPARLPGQPPVTAAQQKQEPLQGGDLLMAAATYGAGIMS